MRRASSSSQKRGSTRRNTADLQRSFVEQLEERQLLVASAVSVVTPAQTVPFQHIIIDQSPPDLPIEKTIVDVDGKSQKDVVIGHGTGPGNGGIFWYQYPLNGDPTSIWNKYTIIPSGRAYEAVEPYDVNGDGAMDLIVSFGGDSTHEGTIYWFENPRGNQHTDPTTVSSWTAHVIGTDTSNAFYLTDLDGDGKLDLVTSDTIFFQNSATSWTQIPAANYQRGEDGVALFDSGASRNGSPLGAIDLAATGTAPYPIAWYENPRDHGGNARTDSWLQHFVGNNYAANDPALEVSYAAMDVNHDGHMDILTVENELGNQTTRPPHGLIWWQAPADLLTNPNAAWIPHYVDPPDGQLRDVHRINLFDMNHDGLTDIVFTEQEQSQTDRVGIFYAADNTGDNWNLQILGTESGHNQDVADINGDGLPDILNSPHGFFNRNFHPIELYINQFGKPLPPPPTGIDAGGPAVGNFAADGGFSGGSAYSSNGVIDTSAVANPAPQRVFQTERYGDFTYTVPNLSSGASYNVVLDFAELYWNAAGQRTFNVSINGNQVLSKYDIFAAAGGKNKAIAPSFPALADANGKITIAFSSIKDFAKIDGIEIRSTQAGPAPLSVNAFPGATLHAPNGSYSSSGSFVDGGAGPWTATVDYGDGTGSQSLALNPDNTFSLSHSYDTSKSQSYTVTVAVTDTDNNATASKTAQVNTVPASAAPPALIDAGGPAAGSYAADNGFSGGTTYSTGASIGTTGVTNPAPQKVYQTERYGNFSYTIPNLIAAAGYTVRLHVAELYWSAAGKRAFNASINGTQVLTNYDIFAAAGGKNKAIAPSFTAIADSQGRIVIAFNTVRDNAKVDGIEIVPN